MDDITLKQTIEYFINDDSFKKIIEILKIENFNEVFSKNVLKISTYKNGKSYFCGFCDFWTYA